MEKHLIDWVDSGREPQCAPNPNYPNGIDIDIAKGVIPNCTVALPYPAKRCGHFVVQCTKCRMNVVVTTAGRPDDPRSIKLPCKVDPSRN